MNSAAAELHPAGPAATVPPSLEPETARWTYSRWLIVITLVFAAHVALLFAFGARKPISPRPVANVPTLQLADADEWFALNDPTLFALPHPRDFAPVISRQKPEMSQPSIRWTEPSGEMAAPGGDPGTAFSEFMRTNRFAGLELQLKPPLMFSTPQLPIEPVLAQTSTLLVEGDLARRPRLNQVEVPSLPCNDVILPSQVQVVVDPAGNVISTVLLPSDNPLEIAGHFDEADRRALELARTARFAPAPSLTVGRLIFHWHTVPIAGTNEPGR